MFHWTICCWLLTQIILNSPPFDSTGKKTKLEECQYMHIKLNSNFISSTIDKSLDNLMVTQMQRLTLIECLKIFLPSIFYTYSPKDYYGP